MACVVSPLKRSVEFKGRRYPVDFSFNAVLECMDVLDMDDLCDTDKMEYVLWRMVRGFVSHNARQGVFEAILAALKRDGEDGEEAISFTQDWPLIKAGFLQAYGINLDAENGKLHWLDFCDLLQGLPAETRMAEIIDIRLRPMPQRTKYNGEEISALIRAKNKVRIRHKSDRESFQSGLARLFQSLNSYAEGR